MGLIKDLGNLLFPEDLCLFCRDNEGVDKEYICRSCKEQVEFLHKEVDLDSPYVEKAYYSVFYNRFLKDHIHDFKYSGKSYLYKVFGHMLLSTIAYYNLEDEIHLISYVPMHRRKEALRGYNQARLLAEYLAKELDKPLLKKNLIKIRHTKDQNKLGKLERQTNLIDSFKAVDSYQFEGKKILLIDDIITTGATIRECGKVLIEKGAREVYGLAITSSKKF